MYNNLTKVFLSFVQLWICSTVDTPASFDASDHISIVLVVF